MNQAPRKAQTLAASLLVLTLGLPGSVPVYPDLRREALRAQAAPQAAGLERLDEALRSPSAAGAEEVRRIDAERFFEEYYPALEKLVDARRREILGWIADNDMEIREVTLPDWITLYVRGSSKFKRWVQEAIPNVPGVNFEWKLAPDSSNARDWEKIGMIFNDFLWYGAYAGPNPYSLPVMNLTPEEVETLDPAQVLSRIFVSLPAGSVYLGAELLTDREGQVRLILFSA